MARTPWRKYAPPEWEEKANKGIADGYAPLDEDILVPTDNLGTGTADNTTFLRGDGVWVAVSGASLALNDLTDVDVPTPSNGDVLTFNSSTGNWEAVPGGVVSDKATVLSYQEATSVSSTVLTTIVTLSPVVDTYISQIECSGMEYGKFQLFYNTVLKATKRGGANRDVTFLFDTPLTVSSGDILDVKVTHFVTGQSPTFECSVLGFT